MGRILSDDQMAEADGAQPQAKRILNDQEMMDLEASQTRTKQILTDDEMMQLESQQMPDDPDAAPDPGDYPVEQSSAAPVAATVARSPANVPQYVMPKMQELVAPNGGAYVGMEDRAPASARGKPVYNHYSKGDNTFYAGYKLGWIPHPSRQQSPQQVSQPQGAQQAGQAAQYAPMSPGPSGSAPEAMGGGFQSGGMPPGAQPEGGADTTYGDLDVSQSRSGQGAWFGSLPRVPAAAPAGSVAIMAPDGRVKHIPMEHAQAALANGGRLVR